jgi:hypothetical protein
MSIEQNVRPGQSIDLEFQVQNTMPASAISAQAELQFLTQADAGWIGTPPQELPEAEKRKYSSCLPWLKLDQSTIDIPALQTKAFTLKMQVPSNARGFYSAALTIKNKPMNGGNGIGVVLRFLIPILIQVDGTVPRRRSAVGDPRVLSMLPNEGSPGGTVLSVLAQNDGEGLIRIAGVLDLFGKVGDQWVKVSTVEVPIRRIIPGGSVRLTANLPKRLPKGRYRVGATLTSDGQRLPIFAQEIDVVGDPAIGTLQPDIPLVVNPAIIDMEGQGGAVRTSSISLRNPGNDPIEVKLSSVLPDKLSGVSLKAAKGDDYGAQAWTEVAPNTITIGPRQERKVRVMMSLPADASKPYYYASILAQAMVNGVAVGSTEILVTVKNTKASAQPELAVGGPIAFSMGDKGMVTVNSAFTNVGEVHVSPQVKYLVKKNALSDPLLTIATQGDATIALPVSTTRFNGTFDLNKLKPGDYLVFAVAEYGDKSVSASTTFRVRATKTGPVIEMIKAPAPKAATPAKGGKG